MQIERNLAHPDARKACKWNKKGKGKREKGKGIPVDLGKITISTIVFFRLHTVLLVI